MRSRGVVGSELPPQPRAGWRRGVILTGMIGVMTLSLWRRGAGRCINLITGGPNLAQSEAYDRQSNMRRLLWGNDMTLRTAGVLVLVGLTPMLSGCLVAGVAAGGAAAVAATQERTVGEAFDDVSVGTEIKTKLLSAGGLGEVDVDVTAGLVLLSGRVQTPELRMQAENIAWTAKRTKDVANEIKIESPGGFFANASDELISARVRARLLGSSSVQARNINVETYGGVVYLMGIARNEKELQKAAEEASYAGGVSQVVSYLRLRDESGQVVPYAPNAGVSAGDVPPQDTGELLGG